MYCFLTATFYLILRLLIYELNYIAVGIYENSPYIKINSLFGKFRSGVLDLDTQSDQRRQFALIAPLLYIVGIKLSINPSEPWSQKSLVIPHYSLNTSFSCKLVYNHTFYMNKCAVLDQYGIISTS